MKNLLIHFCAGALFCLTAFSVRGAAPAITKFTPLRGAVGKVVTITGTNLSGATSCTVGGVSAIVISNTASQLVAMVMPGVVTGKVVVTTAGGTATSTTNFTLTATQQPTVQEGDYLTSTGPKGTSISNTVAVSADGLTAAVGGGDTSSVGAIWIYTRSGDTWVQQAADLVGSGHTGASWQGTSLAISADGNTVLEGGIADNNFVGAAWIFTRTGKVWSQQGPKLVGSDVAGAAYYGWSVALSADGNTALVGGVFDNSGGAAWVYSRSNGVWTQQGNKLVGTGAIGFAEAGWSVALSADGLTAMVGAPGDNSQTGAVWVYVHNGANWVQQGNKLTGTGGITPSLGSAVSLSANGNTAVAGGFEDNSYTGALWVFTRSGTTWTQQGAKLTANDADGGLEGSGLGSSVSITADGNTAVTGGPNDGSGGAVWVFTRSGSTWAQLGHKLAESFINEDYNSTQFGHTVSISADGSAAMFSGGASGVSGSGASYIFPFFSPGTVLAPVVTSFSPATGAAGTLVTIKGKGLYPASISIGGKPVLELSNTGTTALVMVMPGATTGPVTVTNSAGSNPAGSNFTVNPTPYPSRQQGNKLVGTGAKGSAMQASAVAISADGNTAVAGGPDDNKNAGAVWIYTRTDSTWLQQNTKLIGSGASGKAKQGCAVAISADGNTVAVGGYEDSSVTGTVWIFVRNGTTWTQQGDKFAIRNVDTASLGFAVALSANGNLAVIGSPQFESGKGSIWFFRRDIDSWYQADNLVTQGTYFSGTPLEGSSVAVSADGSTYMLGGPGDGGGIGSIWFFASPSYGIYQQQGIKWSGTGSIGNAAFGTSVSLSADGNTAMVGAPNDNNGNGAVWTFTRLNGTWYEGNKISGTGHLGQSVSLSADGNTALIGGYGPGTQAVVYNRNGGTWTAQTFLSGTGAAGTTAQATAVALSADGLTGIVGAPGDNSNAGAAWIFVSSTFMGMVAEQTAGKDEPAMEPAAPVNFGLSVLTYPNPFTEQVQLKIVSNSTDDLYLKVYNITGQLMEERSGLAYGTNLSTGSNYPPGIYIIQIKQGENVKQLKVIKQ